MTAETNHSFSHSDVNKRQYATRNLWTGFLFGLGLIAFVDEAVFHQLLHWHHFYDKSTSDIGLVSDGLFHSFSWFSTIASSFLLADLHRRHAYWFKRWLAGVFLGAGAFQLFDGTIIHKVWELHQIRYGVEIRPYDMIWNLTALAMILAGVLLIVRGKLHSYQTGDTKSNGE